MFSRFIGKLFKNFIIIQKKKNKQFNLFLNYNSDIQFTVKDVVNLKYISKTLEFHDARYAAKNVIFT